MTEDTSPKIDRVGQIMIPVEDLTRAVAFYRDTLGLCFLFQVPGMAFFQVGDLRLMLAPSDLPEKPKGSVLYYRVTDIDRDFEAILARGAQAVEKPHFIARMRDHDLWMGFLRDSEGNTFALMCERTPSH